MAGSTPDFAACKERIDRANAKANAIIRNWKTFQEKNSPTTRIKYQEAGRSHIIVQSKISEFAATFSLEFGEVLYQLRSALDNAIYTCCFAKPTAAKNSAKYKRGIHFPISFESIDNVIRDMFLDEDRASIIKAVQPRHSETMPIEVRLRCYGRALHILNEWAKIDRHRRLHMIGMAVRPEHLRLDFHGPAPRHSVTLYGDTRMAKDECKIGELLIFSHTDHKVDIKNRFTIEISVDEAPEPISPDDTWELRMNTIFEATRAVIQALEESYR